MPKASAWSQVLENTSNRFRTLRLKEYKQQTLDKQVGIKEVGLCVSVGITAPPVRHLTS
jgi:hypothetical protein